MGLGHLRLPVWERHRDVPALRTNSNTRCHPRGPNHVSAASTGRLTCLGLQLQQVTPHVSSSLSVIANLSVGMKTKHFRCVGQREGLDGLYSNRGQIGDMSCRPRFQGPPE